jgi:hypothetical protein
MATNLFDDFDQFLQTMETKIQFELKGRLQRNLNLEFARGH